MTIDIRSTPTGTASGASGRVAAGAPVRASAPSAPRSAGAVSGALRVAAATGLWGVGAGFASFVFAVSTMSPVTLTFWRFAAAAVVLGAIFEIRRLRRGGPGLLAVLRTHLVPSIVIGSTLALAQTLMYASVSSLGAALGTIIPLVMGPIVMAFAQIPVLRVRLNLLGWLTMVPPLVAMVALVLTRGTGDTATSVSLVGVGIAVLGSCAHTTMTLSSKAVSTRAAAADRAPADLLATTTLTFVVAAVVLAPFAGFSGFLGETDRPLAVLGSIAFLVLIASVLAYPLFYGGVARTSPTVTSIVMLTQLVTATLVGTFVLGEHLGVLGWVCLIALVGAVVLHSLTARSVPLGTPGRARV